MEDRYVLLAIQYMVTKVFIGRRGLDLAKYRELSRLRALWWSERERAIPEVPPSLL
jgi:hypothetical protein